MRAWRESYDNAAAWVAAQVVLGTPEASARFTLSMFQASRSGHFSGTDPTLTRLLGRPPRGLMEQLADQVAQ